MVSKVSRFTLILGIFVAMMGCNIANHGSFVTNTYQDVKVSGPLVRLGPVSGQSCQTHFLYLLPMGDSVSSPRAIEEAKNAIKGTIIITDVTIDDTLSFGVGYSEQCINVQGIAFGTITQ
ncbi:TRL domain-containing protein [uncultured Shewanella sp.]|uniref:TRL domain-containing protein n=1 Tax=uncultured Shewanella sp. TaxID=173975 RepID=UPI002633A674|nr:TRL domain-containing protein [uncultured Shewanella sp.]